MAYSEKGLSQSTTSLFDKLSDDLLRKILDKFPCKFVVQCKAVSKRWLSLISDPYFIQYSVHKHHNHQLDEQSFLLQYFILQRKMRFDSVCDIPHLKTSRGKPHLLSFVRQLNHQSIYIVAYFRDLLVCCKGGVQSIYYICNPLTKQWLKLPPAPTCYEETTEIMVGFVCYPYCCNKKQACTTNIRYNYRLVRFPCFSENSNKFNVEIFYSELGEWSQLAVSSPQRLNTGDMWSMVGGMWSVVTYNGILHWLNDKGQSIMAYDPLNNAEQCRIIDPPIDTDELNPWHCIGVCKGSLRIARLTCSSLLSIWELEDYSVGKWRIKHKIYLKTLVLENRILAKLGRELFFCMAVVGFHPSNAVIVYLCFYPYFEFGFISPTMGFISCNMQKGTLEVVSMIQNESKDYLMHGRNFYPIVHPWWPTPVPPLPNVD